MLSRKLFTLYLLFTISYCTQTSESESSDYETVSVARTYRKHFENLRTANILKQWKSLRTRNQWGRDKELQRAIRFIYYKNGEKVYENASEDPKVLEKTSCSADEKFSFILHGWRQTCETEWVIKLIERLTYHRGGCIVCVDYGAFAEASYMWLFRSFRKISHGITRRIILMINEGFDPDNGYIFGFSFGGQLASSIGRSLNKWYLFRNIDTCDMAGPGFDLITNIDHREAARHVQCLHSSRDKGTRFYTCHQNVRLGTCGHFQPAAASQPYYSSHGLCVQIYINAFDYPFYAMQMEPPWCSAKNAATNVPRKFTIGYNEHPNSNVCGEIFVPTSMHYPYNLSEKEMSTLGFFYED